MIAGEFFGKPGGITDSLKIVVNEHMAHQLGWKNAADAIGRQLKNQGDPRTFKIAGVIKDFNFYALNREIGPLSFFHVRATKSFRVLSFKLKPGNIPASLAALQHKWNTLMPG